MPVSTISSALGATWGINQHSQNVINQINGNRSAESMIGEYFGLCKEVKYSDDGKEVVGMVNDFKDHAALQKKKVQFVQFFKDKGMTEEMYFKVIPREFTYVPEVKVITKNKVNEQSNDVSTSESEGEPTLQVVNKRVGKNTK